MRRHEQQMVAIDSTKIETAVSRQPVTLAVLSAATRFFPNPIPSLKKSDILDKPPTISETWFVNSRSSTENIGWK
jgi:hypothetical protein